jgi:dolichol-phosphate mannosyltransferase
MNGHSCSGETHVDVPVSVVIPCFRAYAHILDVIAGIGPGVTRIYIVDDACPEGTGTLVERECRDPRVVVVRNGHNLGVGGAVMAGYRAAIDDGAGVIVKMDGDGQMDPALLPYLIGPIMAGEADYTKGNRFWDLSQIRSMPAVRRVGNLILSFMAKGSTGYWDIFDPTNGYTAIHATVAERLPFAQISNRYFFETDLLFRLNTLRAVVVDVPMDARYGDESSNLKIGSVLPEFAVKHIRNLLKRLAYNYFLRDLSLASLELVAAIVLLAFGVVFGGLHWLDAARTGEATPIGTVMIASIAVVSGLQFLLAFLGHDISSVPRSPLHRLLARRGQAGLVAGARRQESREDRT